MFLDIAKAQLKIDEGIRAKPYRDTVGKLTIAVGRNLDDVGLHADEIELLLDNDVNAAVRVAQQLFDNFDSLSDNRKAVLVNMAFNLGMTRLAGFVHFRSAVEQGQWEQAAVEMLHSTWATEVGQRAIRLAEQMRRG